MIFWECCETPVREVALGAAAAARVASTEEDAPVVQHLVKHRDGARMAVVHRKGDVTSQLACRALG